MSKRWFLLVILLMIALPSVLYAVSMGDIGGMVDKINIQTKTVGIIIFSHVKHGANCNECHPKLFIKKNNSNHVTMKAMEAGKSCGACHNGEKVFSVTGDCARCHAGDILYKDKNVGNILFPHSIHIETLGGCDSCHPDLFKAKQGTNKATMKDMESGKSCGACHDGSDAFGVAVTGDCAKCHAGDILYKDEEAGNVIFPHSVHIEMLGGCADCHPDLFKAQRGANKATMKDMESGKSCGACHDGSSAFNVAEDCESCHKM
jgi:c(7)-type cytochrome triheme protein